MPERHYSEGLASTESACEISFSGSSECMLATNSWEHVECNDCLAKGPDHIHRRASSRFERGVFAQYFMDVCECGVERTARMDFEMNTYPWAQP